MRQGIALPLCAGGEQNGRHARALADAIRDYVAAEKIHRIKDGHARNSNVYQPDLTPLADEYQIGWAGPYARFPGVEDCDAMVLLGYHAKAGTAGAVLDHTMDSTAWQNCWLNGVLTGETGIDAAIAGEKGTGVRIPGD